MSQQSLLAGFALDKQSSPAKPGEPYASKDNNTIATPVGCRLQRIIRLYHGWRIWTATRDFTFGSYLELFDDGRVLNCTTREDEGDEYYWSRPSDADIKDMQR